MTWLIAGMALGAGSALGETTGKALGRTLANLSDLAFDPAVKLEHPTLFTTKRGLLFLGTVIAATAIVSWVVSLWLV